MLSSILAMVATSGKVANGVIFLSFYSLGFVIPMLAIGYLSHYLRSRIQGLQKKEKLVRYFSGLVLILFGLYIFIYGSLIRF
jgi:cytochrome c-type biogenesis protein